MKLFGELVGSFKQGWSQQQPNIPNQSTNNVPKDREVQSTQVNGNEVAAHPDSKNTVLIKSPQATTNNRGWSIKSSSNSVESSLILPWNKLQDEGERESMKEAVFNLSKVDIA